MKAAILSESGLVIGEAAQPEPKASEILVRVRAAGLNRADVLMADGRKHGSLSGGGAIFGLEWAGEVVAAGTTRKDLRRETG